MPPDERGPESSGVGRRTILEGVAGTGLLLGAVTPAAGTAGATRGAPAQDALVLAYHDADRNMVGRSFVVYREPARDDRAVCELAESWRHPVVATADRQDATVVYADLHADRRFAPGTALAVVDRIQGCERDGTAYTGVFLEVVAEPPDVDDPDDDDADDSDGDDDPDDDADDADDNDADNPDDDADDTNGDDDPDDTDNDGSDDDADDTDDG